MDIDIFLGDREIICAVNMLRRWRLVNLKLEDGIRAGKEALKPYLVPEKKTKSLAYLKVTLAYSAYLFGLCHG